MMTQVAAKTVEWPMEERRKAGRLLQNMEDWRTERLEQFPSTQRNQKKKTKEEQNLNHVVDSRDKMN